MLNVDNHPDSVVFTSRDGADELHGLPESSCRFGGSPGWKRRQFLYVGVAKSAETPVAIRAGKKLATRPFKRTPLGRF